MKRAAIILAVAAFVIGGSLAALGAGGTDKGDKFKVVFDNAFGVVKGADFKVGGVPVGSVSAIDVNESDARALITVEVSKGTGKSGFGGLRSDAHCVIAPQSLIGEYFVDCQPGTKGKVLASGATIPVKNTESPIPPDLVLNVMRRPERERFSIILSELGAGLAARGDDLNETIRRALPAIGSTNRVLKILGDNRRTIANLSRESGQVLKVFGRRRKDLGRFVVSAEKAASTTANRRTELAETFRRFPGFLDQLTPTMQDLSTAARLQTPALVDLREASGDVRGLLTTLRPFTSALQPATTSLGRTGRSGRIAAREAASLVKLLGSLGSTAAEPARNLSIMLDALDDRGRAVEPDPDSPGGKGYTGLEAPLQYIFDQTLALNLFDQRGHSLKISLTPDECSDYTTAEDAKAKPDRYAKCNQNLGPNQAGITTPDPSPGGAATRTATRSGGRDDAKKRSSSREGSNDTRSDDSPEQQSPGATSTPAPTATPGAPNLPPVQQLLDKIPELLKPSKGAPAAPSPSPEATQDLLDFLLSP